MLQLTLEEIARVSSGRLFHGNPQKKIKGVSIDSRTIKPQELFIPLKGRHTDGHKFLREVKKRNAAALVRKNFPQSYIPGGLPFIKVRSPLHALGDIANYHRQKFQLPVIAITGSCGKTTVKEMVARILAQALHPTRCRVLKAEGNFNNEIGLPLTLLRLKKGDKTAILEMGMSSPGEIAYLTRISRPSIGVITNINPVHLEACGNLDGVCKAKEELLLNLPEGAKAVLNYDDVRLRKMGENFSGKVISFGVEKKAAFYADKVIYKEGAVSFRLNKKETFILSLSGKANLYNALAAIATASLFNVPFARMRHALKSMSSLPQRLAMSEIHNLKIIDDTYNANPVSYRVAIDALKSLGGKGRHIVVAGDMLELGDASSREHFNLGYYIAKMGVDFLVTIGKWGGKVREGAGNGGLKKDRIFSVNSPEEAAGIVLNIAKPCDKILFKASRKIGLERALNVLSFSLSSL